MLTRERYFTEIAASTASLGALVDGADLTLQVPTCPDWTLRQLATHVGRVQRWVAEIVSSRAAQPISFRDVPDGRIPDDPAQHAEWLRAGADRLTAVLGQAGDVPVWAFGRERPARFWARRMTHEAAVHRVDAQITVSGAEGQPAAAAIPADVAADGIDEWLTEFAAPGDGRPDLRTAGLAEGESLHVHAADVPDGTGEWLVTRDPAGITVRRVHDQGTVALRGGASDLLLVLLQRLPPDTPGVRLHGDPAVLRRWLDSTTF